MPTSQTIAIVLAAGMGTRMRSDTPKVMHRLAGLPLVDHVLAGLSAAGITKATVVLGPEMADHTARFAPHKTVIQKERLGTGHAVKVALDAFDPGESDVLVVYADTPLLTTETINDLLAQKRNAAIAVLGFTPEDPGAYGRLITNGDQVESIVEAADASPDELSVDLCNSGVLVANGRKLSAWVKALKNDNTKGEYYLTHVVALARADDDRCVYTEGEVDELVGINNREDLAVAEGIAQDRYRSAAMAAGVTLTDPASVFLCHDTTFGTDVEVGPFTVFGPGVTVRNHVTIKGFCHFENATVGDRAVVGPYARLRPGAALDDEAQVGNFVEIKNAHIEQGAKVNHLSYVGDARVGKGANIGAGTITANYDGYNKTHTDIGAGASIGSNTVLVAPVKVGDGAITGAGTIVRKDVPANTIAVSEAAQKNREGTADAYRAQQKAVKESKSKDS
ncbi:MAG: bifunctional UDP-N-acetylglucosamine diphosphorylase/glucosamine-1-phosphate N-acetyltransferase GlmU [Alphaproteobacteria bacterium]|nr:bifunctional UDP-N-acetylglucosamine diphosphorylase/glucosamine-1-phosphate N-acetyltransferase GlmU [Alphaproteobacteria bacterium]